MGRIFLCAPCAGPYELRFSSESADALADFGALGIEAERLEVRAKGLKDPLATGIVTRDGDGRLVPLSWSNNVTEPVLFPNAVPAELSKVLLAIEKHLPPDAVILAWCDFSRQIRKVAKRDAPLDDPLARGLLIPVDWASNSGRLQSLWGEGTSAKEAADFATSIEALLSEEAGGIDMLAELAGGRPAYIAVHLSDILKAAAVRPDLVSVASQVFPGAGGTHGVIKTVRQWIEEQKIEGAYAIEPMARPSDCSISHAKKMAISCSQSSCPFRRRTRCVSNACISSISKGAIGSMSCSDRRAWA
jgi:hydroxylamine oxidation protein HaoB